MKVVQIFPGKVWGGAEQYVLDLRSALIDRGHTVECLCFNVPAVTDRLDTEHIPYAIFGKDIRSHIEGADVVHIHDSKFVAPVMKAASKCAVPPKVVLTRHIARASRVMPWSRRAWRNLHGVIFVSRLSRDLWSGVNRWMPAQKCHVVHNSIPPVNTDGGEESLRSRFGISADTPLLTFSGRVRRSKGCEVIVEALAKVRDLPWEMVFVGASKPRDYCDRLAALAEKYGIADRVHFAGFTSEARRLVAQTDIGLQPSIVREACPLSVLELMQSGKPVITTDNGGQAEFVIDGKTGFLIPPENADKLAERLRQLLSDFPTAGEKIGRQAAEYYAENIEYPKFVERITSIYS